MWRTANPVVYFADFRCKRHSSSSCLIESRLSMVEHIFRHPSPVDDIELSRRGGELRVHIVGLTRCSQCAALVEELWVMDLGWQRIIRRISSGLLSGHCVSGGGVSALNHEVADYTVEEIAIVIAFAYQFDKVVTMTGRLIIECHPDIAHRRGEQNLMTHAVGCVLCYGDKLS